MVLYGAKSNFSAKASKLASEMPAIAFTNCSSLWGVTVKLFEHSFAAVLHLVLRLARLESFGQVPPESVKSRIRHVEETADIGAAVAVKKVSGILRIAVLRGLALAVSRQHIQSHERVEEVGDAAWMKFERVLKLSCGQRLVTQHSKQVQFDG